MSFRVGIDLVPFSRVRRIIADDAGLLRRYLTQAEIAASTNALGLDVPGIAGRLAAKEAYFKLLRTQGKPVPWLALEVLKGPGGWPVLTARAVDAAPEHVDISITHDDGYAVAVAVGATDTERTGPGSSEAGHHRGGVSE